jgi:hypothetical protein
MIVYKNDKGIRVLNKINFNNKIDLKNLDFPNISLKNEKEFQEFIEYLKIFMKIIGNLKMKLIHQLS